MSISRRRFVASTSFLAAGHALLGSPGVAQASPAASAAPSQAWQDKPVLDFSNSPHAKLRQVPVSAVTLTGFWASRRQTNVAASIPSMRQELLDHGRLTNFQRLTAQSTAPQRGPVYSDSDLYKWLEAVGFALQSNDNAALRRECQSMIRDIVAVQEPGGYLNTYFVAAKRADRMTQHTQEGGHELYCIGHLLQGAIAFYRATGDRTMLDAGIRFVDNFLLPAYGPGPNQTPIVSGHPEIEMALIELYRTTGRRQYLDLAGYILHGDTRWAIRPQSVTYMFCGIPFTTRTKLEGHAVRVMYACCGATDFYLETGDPAYWKTLTTLWHDLSQHQMYVTGGVGARSEGEAFGAPYELPNATAYGESCAAIGNMMWNARMLAASGEARFTDVIERALYNGINSGMSLDGRLYCYRNPLAFEPKTGDVIRNAWYDTTCCPPNLERTLASLPGYFYSTAKDGLYVHLYDASELNWRLEDGTAIHVAQQTEFPWDGKVRLTVTPAHPTEFTLYLRIPGWSATNTVHVNGEPVSGTEPGQYLALHRRWAANEQVDLAFDMTPQVLRANPAVTDDIGKVAIQRGPLVYCMEELDQNTHPVETNLDAFRLQPTASAKPRFEATLLNGITVLSQPGTLAPAPENAALYSPTRPAASAAHQTTSLTLIPYYAWANRAPSAMQVWIPIAEEANNNA